MKKKHYLKIWLAASIWGFSCIYLFHYVGRFMAYGAALGDYQFLSFLFFMFIGAAAGMAGLVISLAGVVYLGNIMVRLMLLTKKANYRFLANVFEELHMKKGVALLWAKHARFIEREAEKLFARGLRKEAAEKIMQCALVCVHIDDGASAARCMATALDYLQAHQEVENPEYLCGNRFRSALIAAVGLSVEEKMS